MCEIKGRTIGPTLKRLLRERNMTQGDISRATYIKRSYVSDIFNGKINAPRLDTFQKIAKALNMSVSELVFEIESDNEHKRKLS